jgi:hypothetical protein
MDLGISVGALVLLVLALTGAGLITGFLEQI